MPYAPGVQDISGQLRAQGIAQAGHAWSQAIGNIGKDLGDAFQTYKQNQFITNQAMGQIAGYTRANPEVLKYLEGASSDDPNAPTLSPEILKSWASVKTGEGVKMKDAAMVKSFLEAYDKNKMDQAQRLHIENQNKLLGQQFEQNQRMADFMKQYMTPQPPSGVPAGVGMPSAGVGAGTATGAAPTGEPTARDVTAKLIQSTGKMPTPAQVTAQLRQDLLEYRKGQIESKEYTSPELAASAAKDAVAKGAYPEGTIPVVKKNAQTGTYYLETTTSSVEPAAVSAERKRKEAGAELRAKSDSEYIAKIRKEGAAAIDDTFVNQQIRDALKSKVETGPVEAFKQNVRKIAIGSNLADEETIKNANKFDELEGLMMRGQLEFAQNFTRGNLNTFEQRLVESAVANARAKLPGANAYLNDVVEAIKQKKAAHAMAEKDFRKQYKDEGDRAEALRDWELDPANGVNRFFQKLRAESATPVSQAAAPAAGGAGPSVGQSQYITGATYKNKRNEEFIWDGTKMVPKK